MVLDHLSDIKALDPHNMLGAVLSFPEMAERGRELALAAELGSPGSPRAIVVCALGSSAIGADLTRTLLADQLRVPMIVNREYDVPEFVDESSLVVVSSYSGETEETLSAFAQAQERGAQILAITTGGKLHALARDGGYPCVLIPGGYPARAALAFGFFPLLYTLVRYGLAADPGQAFNEMLSVTRSLRERCAPEVPSEKNMAKTLAKRIAGLIPIVYGSEGYRGVVASRWKSQFNENAKTLALSGVFPEMNHNETLAWSGVGDLGSKFCALVLRDPKERKAIVQRVELTKQIIAKNAAQVVDVWSEGSSDLAKMCSLLYLADFISVYLAYLYRQDPSCGAAVEWLKAELAKV